jgi:hypothetical protein
MAVHRFRVHYADGDDFARTFSSDVEVEGDSVRDAQLAATQLAYTPQPGKPEHLQILNVEQFER